MAQRKHFLWWQQEQNKEQSRTEQDLGNKIAGEVQSFKRWINKNYKICQTDETVVKILNYVYAGVRIQC